MKPFRVKILGLQAAEAAAAKKIKRAKKIPIFAMFVAFVWGAYAGAWVMRYTTKHEDTKVEMKMWFGNMPLTGGKNDIPVHTVECPDSCQVKRDGGYIMFYPGPGWHRDAPGQPPVGSRPL